MSDSDEDLEALFEKMAMESASSKTEVQTPVAATVVEHDAAKAAHGKIAHPELSHPPQHEEFHFDSDTAKPMFDRIGGVVRILHDSMRELGYDRSLSHATSQITDAQGRLEHIANLTEQAANKVLNATDEGLPEQDVLAKSAKNIDARWATLFAGQMSVEAFKELAKDSQGFAKQALASTDSEKARLLEIMMAQDFQDLTGQLIKKVVAITGAVERELAQILIDNAPIAFKERPVELMQGPSSPASALEQDDVDNLLDSLGF